jgi:hypothetical protein
MDRAAKRRAKKAITKRLEVLRNSRLLKSKVLTTLPAEQQKLLAEGTHPDKELQSQFYLTQRILREMVELEGRLVGLSLKPEENLSDVQEP